MSSKPSQKPKKSQPSQAQSSNQPPKPSIKKEKLPPETLNQQIFTKFDPEFEQHSKNLSRLYSRFLSTRNDWSQPLTARKLFLKWLNYYHEKTEEDFFKGKSHFNVIANPDIIYKAPDERILFQNYNFLKILGGSWPLRFDRNFFLKNIISYFFVVIFTGKFIQKLTELPLKTHEIYNYICELCQGNFAKIKATSLNLQSTLPYMAFFSCKISDKKIMIFNVGVEKVPILDKYGKVLISFEFIHYMRFLDIIKENTDVLRSCAKFLNVYLTDPARSDFFQELQEENKFKIKNPLFTREREDTFGEPIQLNIREICQPVKFKSIFLTKTETNSMIFDEKTSRWMPSDLKFQHEKRMFLHYSKQVNEELLKQYADFSSAARLVDLLEKIPNFKLKLTSQEKDVIGQSGNVLAIGRSGTGKTTCAILRIFSMEILFKIRVSLYKNKLEGLLKDTRFDADDLDKKVGLHCLFVTASPVLTTEVQRYYERLTKQIKEELKKKQIKDKAKREAEKLLNEEKEKQELEKEKKEEKEMSFIEDSKVLKQEEEEIIMTIDKEKTEVIEEVEKQMKELKIQDEVEKEDKDLGLDDEELQKKLLKYTSMNELKEEDFPAFLTMKNLLIMVDGALARPFFTRNKDNQIIGGDSSAHWHSETKGVLMIDDYHRKLGDVDKKPEELEAINDEDDEDKFDYDNEEELEYAYQRELFLQEAHKKTSQKKDFVSDLKRKLSFEVDYEYFETYFWPKVLKKYQHLSISPTAVWTEIYSYIKGSTSSHLHPAGYLPEKVYLDLLSERKSLMDLETKKLMFELYCMYERWKTENSGYDLLDVVNYILTQIRYGRYSGTPIHYMMVDEVQDLPHAMLLLLTQITEQGLFFSGDTAQNIAKGVGFRFCDLSHVFDKSNFPNHAVVKPSVMHLTINFRSHSRILDLANSLVSILELCFPKTIDRLKKEKSNLDGPKPMLLEHNDTELLFLVLLGEADYKKQKEGGLLTRPQVEFGCNQVILVRDQKSKEKIPKILQHALCLTIYEAKGLEFDDVILFNFFADSTMETNKWSLLNHLLIADKLIDKDEYLKSITIHETEKQKLEELEEHERKENEEDDFDKLYGAKEKDGKVITKHVKLNNTFFSVDINQYSIVCNELKQLYTAITRPRNKLIIFDDNFEKREILTQYWSKLELVEVISKETLDKIQDIQENVEFKGAKEYNIFKSILRKTSNEEWKTQGLKMMKHKYYEQAIKCFEKAGETSLLKRAQAFHEADDATKIIAKIEAERVYISEKVYQYADLKKYQRKEAKKRLTSEENEAINNLKQAAELFLAIDLPKQAAQCFFSAKEYQKACGIYLKLELWTQAGEAYFIMEDYKKAAECFDKTQDYIRVMECYEAMEEWEKLIEIVYKYKAQMKAQDRESYIKKFVPLALEKLVSEICFQNEDGLKPEPENQQTMIAEKIDSDEEEDDDSENEENKNEKIAHEEIKIHDKEKANVEKEENKNEKIAHEEIIIDDKEKEPNVDEKKNIEKTDDKEKLIIGSSSEQIEKQEKALNENPKIQELTLDEVSKLEEIPLNNNNKTGQKIDPTTSIIENLSLDQKNNNKNISFEEMNHSDIQSQLEKNEHLSNIDLDDEFLKQESVSLIESLSQIRKENSRIQSDYSSIEYSNYMGNNQNMAIVKTKTDIYAQDQTMQKIIRYISFFSEDFREHLTKIRSKKFLLSEGKPNENEYDYLVDLIIDLDNIDLDFLHLILDSLETFKIYKLCIFICNRYKLSTRIGRYLVSIANRYSPFAQEALAIPMLPTHFINPLNRKAQLEKAFIANIALHNVLENIHPNYLKLKKINEEIDSSNSLGIDTFQGLIQLGFWKKCVFLTDYLSALAITSSFADFETYKHIFILYDEKYSNNQTSLECLKSESEFKRVSFAVIPFTFPNNSLQMDFCLLALDHINWFFSENFTFCVNKTWTINNNKPSDLFEPFPNYFAYNGVFWKYIFDKNPEKQEELLKLFEQYMNEGLKSLMKIFKNESFENEFVDLRIYDLVIFFTNILIFGNGIPDFKKLLTNLPNSTLGLFLSVFEKLVESSKKLDRLSKFSELILRAVLSVFRIRLIKDCEVFKMFGISKVLLHRSSSIFFELLDPINKGSKCEVFPIDIDGDFYLADLESCLQIIHTKLFQTFKEIFMRKMRRLDVEKTSILEEACCLGWITDRFKHLLKHSDLQLDRLIDQKQHKKIQVKKNLVNDEEIDIEEEERAENLIVNPQQFIFDPKTLDQNLYGLVEGSYLNLNSKEFWPNSCSKKREIMQFSLWVIGIVLEEIGKGLSDDILGLHWKIVKSFEILRVIGRETLIYELLHAKKKNKNVANYFKLIEAYWYKNYNCVEEYVECFFEYFSQIINLKSAPFEEKLIRLTETSLSATLAYNLMKPQNNKSFIRIPTVFLKYLPDLTKEINPLTVDRSENLIYEIFFWIKKICRFPENLNYRNTIHIVNLIMTLIINCNKAMKDESFKEIEESVSSLQEYVGKKTVIKSLTTLKGMCKSFKDLVNSSEKMASQGKIFEEFTIEKVEVKTSKEAVERNLEECDREWLNFQGKIAKRMIAKRIILRFYRKKTAKHKKIKTPENSMVLLRFLAVSFEEKDYNNLIDFFTHYSFFSEQIGLIELLCHDVLRTFYKNPLENSLDFHYLNKQSVYILGVYQDLKMSILEYIKKNNQKILFEEFVKTKKNLEGIKESFEIWKSSNIKTEKLNELDTKRNRKILALKLAKKGMVTRATQIAQRRAGLRKQRALQEKAVMLKFAKMDKK